MKKVLVGLLVLAAVGFGVWKYNLKPVLVNENEKLTIKIGVGLPLTGDSQESGQIAKKTIDMFKEDLAKRDLKNNYEFIVEDNVYENKHIMAVNNKFVHIDKVDAIISYWNVPGIITSEILKNKNILHFNFGSDPKALQTKYDFLFYSSPEEQANLLLLKAKKEGIKKVAILGCNNDWSHIMQKAVESQKEKLGIEIVNTQFVNIGERNFNLTLEKMKGFEPELYILFLETPEFEIARKKMIEMDIKEPVTSSEVPDYTAEKELFEGAWYVTLPEGDSGFNAKFKEFSGMDNTYGASYIYDIASLIVDGYEKANNKENVADVIQTLQNFNGKTGEANLVNNFFTVPAVLKKIKSAESIDIEE